MPALPVKSQLIVGLGACQNCLLHIASRNFLRGRQGNFIFGGQITFWGSCLHFCAYHTIVLRYAWVSCNWITRYYAYHKMIAVQNGKFFFVLGERPNLGVGAVAPRPPVAVCLMSSSCSCTMGCWFRFILGCFSKLVCFVVPCCVFWCIFSCFECSCASCANQWKRLSVKDLSSKWHRVSNGMYKCRSHCGLSIYLCLKV